MADKNNISFTSVMSVVLCLTHGLGLFRNRQSLEGKYVAKLTLEELNCFYEQVITLPCRIREAVLIKVCGWRVV